MAAVMHMEGAEAIDAEFRMLELFHAAGLRSLGPVWSRPTIFGHGVPMRFPGHPDTGPGLTDTGRALVRACNDLGILIDLSHLNEKGFDDVAAHSDAPLVASHSNVHALCPSSRNLTDRQLDVIRDSDGLVGLNFAAVFLREDGRMRADFGIDVMLRHLDHLIARLGETRVALGSDFDGAIVSEEIGDVAGLTRLRAAMRAHGYDAPLMEKLCHGNWLRVLDATLRT
jgi:membrane dipeptidase